MSEARELLDAFVARRPLLVHLGVWIELLLTDLLRQEGISPHSVQCRVKEHASLARKVSTRENRYASLDDVTDCLGLRVITYFADEVDRVAAIIASNFEVDHVVDKRTSSVLGSPGEPAQFGYQSLHYVVRIKGDRAALPEWAPLGKQLFEIQLRSILQHAWAEIEHDLGYKAAEAVPAASRSRFSRLAGLLDLADDEFIGIRDELQEYKSTVEEQVSADPSSVAPDRDSLRAFVMENPTVAAVDTLVAAARNRKLGTDALDSALSRRAVEFRLLGLKSIGDVESALETHRPKIAALAEVLRTSTKSPATSFLPRGSSLLYLGYVLTVMKNDTWAGVRRDLVASGRSELTAPGILSGLRAAWRKMRQQTPSLPGPKTPPAVRRT